MDINLHPGTELEQKLVLSPQMRQSIEILQMGYQELESFIDQESLENPVIEVERDFDELEHDEKIKKKLEWLEDIDEQNRVYYQSGDVREEYDCSLASNEYEDLVAYLSMQLELTTLTESDYRIARYIIQSLDENGYLDTDIGDIASACNISIEKAENALKLVQTFEPWGIGARNLEECLKVQLKSKGVEDQKLYLLISKYLNELGKNKLLAISRELGIKIDDVKRYRSIIKTLNPHPGASFSQGQHTRYIKPDIVVIKFKDYFEVMLNDFACPRVNISSYYRNLLESTDDNNVKDYINKKMEKAFNIMKCIEQRNNTLLSVGKAIVDIQRQFFNKGPGYLVPMVLRDVAEKVSVHESTVSRAIHDKYLQSSWGTYRLKHFFSSGLHDMSMDKTADNIKMSIREIINSEDKSKPLSDQKITEILLSRGVDVARRTVAKYREEINVPAAVLRKNM